MYKQKHGESMATPHGDKKSNLETKLKLPRILPRYVKPMLLAAVVVPALRDGPWGLLGNESSYVL
jgi:hypothetical protein